MLLECFNFKRIRYYY